MAIVTPTDHPKSVRSRCVIEVFCAECVSLLCFLVFVSVGVKAIVIGLSQISSFFLFLSVVFWDIELKFGFDFIQIKFDFFFWSCLTTITGVIALCSN